MIRGSRIRDPGSGIEDQGSGIRDRGIQDSSPDAKTLPVTTAKPDAVARLIFGAVPDARLVAGVGGLELALAFQVPGARLVFLARLDSVLSPAFVAGPIGVGLLRQNLGDVVVELGTREAAV